MTDLDNLLELQNALAAPSRDRDRLRKYSAADYQRLAIIGRRIFVLSLGQVCLLPALMTEGPSALPFPSVCTRVSQNRLSTKQTAHV